MLINTLSQLRNSDPEYHEYDLTTINAALGYIVTGSIYYLQTMANTTSELTANWTSDRSQITTDIEAYLASFDMDDAFIR